MGKTILKWGFIGIVVLVAWRYLSGFLAGIGGGGGGGSQNYAPVNNYPGVYGSPGYPYNDYYNPTQSYNSNPFFSAPDNPNGTPSGGNGGGGYGGGWNVALPGGIDLGGGF
jgi:hypothetical protein